MFEQTFTLSGCGKILDKERWYTAWENGMGKWASTYIEVVWDNFNAPVKWRCGGPQKHDHHQPWLCESCAKKAGIVW